MKTLEVWVSDHSLEILSKGRTLFTVGVTEDNRVIVACPHFDEIEWGDTLYQAGALLSELEIVIDSRSDEEITPMGLPRRLKREFKGEQIKIRPFRPGAVSDNPEPIDHIDHWSRDQVLTALLDSILENPNPSGKMRAAETKRIASENKVEIMQVAAVRANLTRGTYGKPDEVLARRRRFRERHPKIGS